MGPCALASPFSTVPSSPLATQRRMCAAWLGREKIKRNLKTHLLFQETPPNRQMPPGSPPAAVFSCKTAPSDRLLVLSVVLLQGQSSGWEISPPPLAQWHGDQELVSPVLLALHLPFLLWIPFRDTLASPAEPPATSPLSITMILDSLPLFLSLQLEASLVVLPTSSFPVTFPATKRQHLKVPWLGTS